jgi:hypothetical protein
MSRFLRWLLSTILVAAVFGVWGGAIAKYSVYVPINERDRSIARIEYERAEDEAFLTMWMFVAGSVVVFSAFAGSIRLPAAAKSMAVGALLGVAFVVLSGLAMSAAHGDVGIRLQRNPPYLRITRKFGMPVVGVIKIGIPVSGVLGAIAGFAYHARQEKNTQVT